MTLSTREIFIGLLVIACLVSGLVLSPHRIVAGTRPAPPKFRTLSFQIRLNDAGEVKTSFVSSEGKRYLGVYRIVINSLDPALIGGQNAVTTSPDTWTDYIQLDQFGWSRNHRIAPPYSQQPGQWTGFQPVSGGTTSGNNLSVILTLPDLYLADAKQFNASLITYIAPEDNPNDLHPIDALGPPLSSSVPIEYLMFDAAVSPTNYKSDPLGDYASYPADLADLSNADYRNFDIQSLTVVEQ